MAIDLGYQAEKAGNNVKRSEACPWKTNSFIIK